MSPMRATSTLRAGLTSGDVDRNPRQRIPWPGQPPPAASTSSINRVSPMLVTTTSRAGLTLGGQTALRDIDSPARIEFLERVDLRPRDRNIYSERGTH